MIEQRLEDVMVAAIDECYANVRMVKSASGRQPTKAAADNDYVRCHRIVED